MSEKQQGNHFILSIFDVALWCPVFETRFAADDLDVLREIAESNTSDDPDFEWHYSLDDGELQRIRERFGVVFDIPENDFPECQLWLKRERANDVFTEAPYLIHTGFELPLLLEGRKKLAWFVSMDPEAESAFDKWVEKGLLHKHVEEIPVPEFLMPFAIDPNHKVNRSIYYTLKGEEWRIPAMKLLRQSACASEGWGEEHERLQGMLFGYEDWQNNWWLERCNRVNGGVGGMPLCCAVDKEGFEWIKSAGFGALPPIGSEELEVRYCNRDAQTDELEAMLTGTANIAVIRFKVSYALRQELFPVTRHKAGPFHIKRSQIPRINSHLTRHVDVLLKR